MPFSSVSSHGCSVELFLTEVVLHDPQAILLWLRSIVLHVVFQMHNVLLWSKEKAYLTKHCHLLVERNKWNLLYKSILFEILNIPAYPSSLTPDPGCEALHVALSVPCQALSAGGCDDSSRRVHGDGDAVQRRTNRGRKGRLLALTGVSVEEFGKGRVGEASEGGAKEWVCVYLKQSTRWWVTMMDQKSRYFLEDRKKGIEFVTALFFFVF